MISVTEKYIVDSLGKPIEVVLPYDYYQKLLFELEETDELKAFDAAKARDEEFIPFSKAMEEIGL
ncbi:MAG: hypothetical protein NT007_17875 [Candidatus Kapabacteria bacterium]|nr:hypothetical protein [Candidatus Kapabacteria bacterium]